MSQRYEKTHFSSEKETLKDGVKRYILKNRLKLLEQLKTSEKTKVDNADQISAEIVDSICNKTSKSIPVTQIVSGCCIKGEITLDSDIQVDGKIDGKMTIERTLTISASGEVYGEVHADNVIVNGVFNGICYANKIEVLNSGFIKGSIYTDNFIIVPGGRFVGTVSSSEEKGESQKLLLLDADE
ncbi:bactofilin family protein [Photobacterium toruni]|uniref:bactofilin family protein n=1 Tax=Photobacterium toruni TaxID=1935446 RepID=UPI00210F9B10|nr:polymer-forming cytoskeletal protein [Photobacterium toruni]